MQSERQGFINDTAGFENSELISSRNQPQVDFQYVIDGEAGDLSSQESGDEESQSDVLKYNQLDFGGS